MRDMQLGWYLRQRQAKKHFRKNSNDEQIPLYQTSQVETSLCQGQSSLELEFWLILYTTQIIKSPIQHKDTDNHQTSAFRSMKEEASKEQQRLQRQGQRYESGHLKRRTRTEHDDYPTSSKDQWFEDSEYSLSFIAISKPGSTKQKYQKQLEFQEERGESDGHINDFWTQYKKKPRYSRNIKYPTLQQQFQRRLYYFQKKIGSKDIYIKSIKEEWKKLKFLFQNIQRILIEIIEIKKKLLTTVEQLISVRKQYQSTQKDCLNSIKSQNPQKKEVFLKILLIFKKIYEDLVQEVKELEARLERLKNEALIKRRQSIKQLQSRLAIVQNKRELLAQIKERIHQRAQIDEQLQDLYEQQGQLQKQRKKILKHLRNAKEKDLHIQEINELNAASKQIEEKLQIIGIKIKEAQDRLEKI